MASTQGHAEQQEQPTQVQQTPVAELSENSIGGRRRQVDLKLMHSLVKLTENPKMVCGGVESSCFHSKVTLLSKALFKEAVVFGAYHLSECHEDRRPALQPLQSLVAEFL